MSLLAPSYDRYMQAKAEFMAKHDELIALVELPHRFVGAYFGSVRAQITARYEQLLRPLSRGGAEKDLEKEQRISDVYAWLIEEINASESKCIQSLTSRNKQATQKTSSAFETGATFYPSPSTTSSENDSSGDLGGALFDINKEIESAKARLLDNQSFVFVESDRNGFGTLFEFKDRYLSVKERLFLESKQAFTNQSNFTSTKLSPRDKCHFIKAYWIDPIMRIEECIDLVQYSLTKATMIFRIKSSKSQLTITPEPSEVEDHELDSQIKSEPSETNESQMNDDSGELHGPQLDESRSVDETMTATERELSEAVQPFVQKFKATKRMMPLLQPGMVVWANWHGRLTDGILLWPGCIVAQRNQSCQVLFSHKPENQHAERSMKRVIPTSAIKLFFDDDNHHELKRKAASSSNFDSCYQAALENLREYLNKRPLAPARSEPSKSRLSLATQPKHESEPEAESSSSFMETSQDQEPMTAKESEIYAAIQPLLSRSNRIRQIACFLEPGLVVWANWYAKSTRGNFMWPGRIVKRAGATDVWRVKFYDVPEEQTEKALDRVIFQSGIRFFFNQGHFDYKKEASASGNFEWCYEKALSDLARYLRSIPASESVDQPMESSEAEKDDQSSESEYEPEADVSVSMDTSSMHQCVADLNTTAQEREVCEAMQPLLQRSAELHLVSRFYKPGFVVWVDWNCGNEAAKFMWPARILDKAGERDTCWKVQFFEAPENQHERKTERVCSQCDMHFFFTQAHATCKAKAASSGNFEWCYQAALEDLAKYLGEHQTKRLPANQEHQVNAEVELGDLSRVENSADDDPTMSVDEWKAFEASQPLLKEVKILKRLGCLLKPGLVVWANWYASKTVETFMWPGKILAPSSTHSCYKLKFYDVPDNSTTRVVEQTKSVTQIRLFFAKGHSLFKREAASSSNFERCYETAVADLLVHLENRPASWVLSDTSDADESHSDSESEEKSGRPSLTAAETAELGGFDEEMMTNNERETYEAAQPFLNRVRASKKSSRSFFRPGLVIWTNWNKSGEIPFMWPGKITGKGLNRSWRVQFYYAPENQKVWSTDRVINASAIHLFFDSSHFDFKNQASESNNFEWCYQSALRDLQKFLEKDALLF